jgi:hypothetical protein
MQYYFLIKFPNKSGIEKSPFNIMERRGKGKRGEQNKEKFTFIWE